MAGSDKNLEAQKDVSKVAPTVKGGLSEVPPTRQGVGAALEAFTKNEAANPKQQLPEATLTDTQKSTGSQIEKQSAQTKQTGADVTAKETDHPDHRTITNSDGSSMDFYKDNSFVEHTKDGITIHKDSSHKIVQVEYPKDSTGKIPETRTLSFDEKTRTHFMSRGNSTWESKDGLHWDQTSGDRSHHMVGLMSFGPDGSFKFVNMCCGKDITGKPETPHVTAYDKLGQPVADTANKDNFHAEITKLCQEYIQTTGGDQVKASDIEKLIDQSAFKAPSQQVIAAEFLHRMLPAKTANTTEVDPIITLTDAKKWLESAKNLDDAAIAIARELSGDYDVQHAPKKLQKLGYLPPQTPKLDESLKSAKPGDKKQPGGSDEKSREQSDT